jgi:hypothetical protein
MAATHQFSESNTVSETVTDGITNLNFGSNDSVNLVPATYPIIAGQNSFIKYLRSKFSGTFTEISNMKFWKSSGTYVIGEAIKAGANASFATPVQTSSGDSDIPTSEGTALSIQASSGASTITAAGYTKYIRLQAQISGSASAGAANQKEFTFQYDEV